MWADKLLERVDSNALWLKSFYGHDGLIPVLVIRLDSYDEMLEAARVAIGAVACTPGHSRKGLPYEAMARAAVKALGITAPAKR
jgi:hypothetical protein